MSVIQASFERPLEARLHVLLLVGLSLSFWVLREPTELAAFPSLEKGLVRSRDSVGFRSPTRRSLLDSTDKNKVAILI